MPDGLRNFDDEPHKPDGPVVSYFEKNVPSLVKMNIGKNSNGYGVKIGAPYVATDQQVDDLEGHGEVFLRMLETTNHLYTRALKGGLTSEQRDLVIKLCEAGVCRERKSIQRDLFLGTDFVDLPLFFRADMLDTSMAVELNIPGGGQALVQGIQKLVNARFKIGSGLIQSWAEAIKEATNTNSPRVALASTSNSPKGNEYVSEVLGSHGVNVTMFSPLPNVESVDMVINMAFHKSKSWDPYWKAYRDGNLTMDRPPTTIHSSKVNEILAFHPVTRHFYAEEIRDRFPQTYLVEEGTKVTLPSGEEIGIEDLWYPSARQREFVLKYAGSDRERASGASHVFQLDGSKEKAMKLIHAALDDWEQNGEPWLLQPRVKVNHTAYPYENGEFDAKKMRARFMPYYVTLRDEVTLAASSVLFDSNWKVHGNERAVHSPMIRSSART